MDSGPLVAASQKKKPTKRQKSKKGEDMISNLPNFIIGRILSLLPSTKDAVRTGVLSKSWIYRWTFITDLRFDDKERFTCKNRRKMCFLNHVNRVLLHLNNASIQSFFLRISSTYDPSHINEWISAVLSGRGVKKLCVNSQKQLSLSSYALLKCQSLEVLVLQMDAKCVIKVPNFVCLSSLTVLELTGIKFTCYTSNDSKTLTLNFPLLKKYKSKDCTWSGVKSITFEVPLLELLSIDYRPRPWFQTDAFNAEINSVFGIASLQTHVVIEGKKLSLSRQVSQNA